MQARGALLLSKYSSSNDTITMARVAFGLILYVFGMYTNIQCDGILRNLRKPGETGYKIPRGQSLYLNKAGCLGFLFSLLYNFGQVV